jgi:hypothetical protein
MYFIESPLPLSDKASNYFLIRYISLPISKWTFFTVHFLIRRQFVSICKPARIYSFPWFYLFAFEIFLLFHSIHGKRCFSPGTAGSCLFILRVNLYGFSNTSIGICPPFMMTVLEELWDFWWSHKLMVNECQRIVLCAYHLKHRLSSS